MVNERLKPLTRRVNGLASRRRRLRRRSSGFAQNTKKAGLLAPPDVFEKIRSGSEQAQDALVRLVGERQRGLRELLARLQREEGGGFLVLVGVDEVVGAGAERVDHGLGEVLTGLHDGEVRAESRRNRLQRGQGVG